MKRLLYLVAFLVTSSASAQITIDEHRLAPTALDEGDTFGYSVGIADGTVAVSAPFANNRAGRVFVFSDNGGAWTEADVLSPDGQAGGLEFFGISVAVSGPFAAVGAIGDDTAEESAGAVYLFQDTGNGWSRVQKVVGSTLGFNNQFGHAVALDGDVMVAAAPNHNTVDSPWGGTNNAGAVYAFRWDGSQWTEEAYLPGPVPAERMGYDLDYSDSSERIIAGSYTVHSSDVEKAHIFRYSNGTWESEAVLTASDGGNYDQFGYGVAIDGDVAVVGAYNHGPGVFDNRGAAYVFRYDGVQWVEEAKLVSPSPADYDFFGRKLDVSGNYVAVSAIGVDANGLSDVGAVLLYSYDGSDWTFVKQIEGSGLLANSYLGDAVALEGANVVAGAGSADDAVLNGGAAFVFGINDPSDADADGITNILDNCVGVANPGQEDGDADGLGDACDPEFNVDSGLEAGVETVENLQLGAGLETSLVGSLDQAAAQVENGNPTAASGSLTAFINKVNAKRGKKLTDAEADALIALAQAMLDALAAGKGGLPTEPEAIPTDFTLGNYPNPFNPVTTIQYALPEESHVRLEVFDMTGRRIALLVDGMRQAGTHEVRFGQDGLSSGLYLYRMETGNQALTGHMVLMK